MIDVSDAVMIFSGIAGLWASGYAAGKATAWIRAILSAA